MATLRLVYIRMATTAVVALMFQLGMYLLNYLICTFLNVEDSNKCDAEVIGERTLKNGLVVPAVYSLRTRNKNISDVLNKELQGIKKRVKSMNITVEKTVTKPVLL